MAFLADTLQRIKPSATIAVTDKARALKAAGRDVIGLGAGEPDFDTPDNIKEAAIKAIRERQDASTPMSTASPSSRPRSSRKFKRENGLDYKPSQIIGRHRRQAGALQRLHGDAQSGRRGDHPGAVLGELSRHGAARRRRAGPVVATAESGFKLKPEQLERAITPKTKWLHPQLAVEPDRRGLYAGRAEGAHRRAAAPSACVGADRRHVRAPGLRRLRVHHARRRSSRSSMSAR